MKCIAVFLVLFSLIVSPILSEWYITTSKFPSWLTESQVHFRNECRLGSVDEIFAVTNDTLTSIGEKLLALGYTDVNAHDPHHSPAVKWTYQYSRYGYLTSDNAHIYGIQIENESELGVLTRYFGQCLSITPHVGDEYIVVCRRKYNRLLSSPLSYFKRY